MLTGGPKDRIVGSMSRRNAAKLRVVHDPKRIVAERAVVYAGGSEVGICLLQYFPYAKVEGVPAGQPAGFGTQKAPDPSPDSEDT